LLRECRRLDQRGTLRIMTSAGKTENLQIRRLEAADLDAADRIMRLAFGTFLGLPDPMSFMGDADYVRSRRAADPDAAFAAVLDGEVVATNFATHWGSVSFFGPLTVHPRLWDAGIGARLVEAVVDRFDDWGSPHTGLFTFPQSTKHIGLYRRFGFWPRSLTAVMRKPVNPAAARDVVRLSQLAPTAQEAAIAACAGVTDSVLAGLDVSHELRATAAQKLGDTVLLEDASGVAGFAVCHLGAGSEAGSGACYIKFGAVRPGRGADFDRLLAACESLAAAAGAEWLDAGTSYSRPDAMARMNSAGFRAGLNGVSMHRPDEPGYHRGDAYVIDDWR
jgi:GNAT superfamily N-acetyltransferase